MGWVQHEPKEALATAAPRTITIDRYVTVENLNKSKSIEGPEDIESGVHELPEDEKLAHIHNRDHNFGLGLHGHPELVDIIPLLKFERTCVVGKS